MGISEIFLLVTLVLVVAALAFLGVHFINARTLAQELKIKHEEAEKRLIEARRQADDLVKKALREAKELALTESKEFDRLQKEKNQDVKKFEERLQKREEGLEKRSKQLEQKEVELQAKQQVLEKEFLLIKENTEKSQVLLEESKQRLESMAQLSIEEAREQLKKSIESEVRRAASADIRQAEDDARRVAEDRARGIIATSIQRLANEFVADSTVSVISLPSDDMKGRIIGREGRNIRAIEQATGVDLIIDDTPEAIIISCFNPIRREIAKAAIERLIADGRIHPARIEEVVQKSRSEFEQMVREVGERSSFDCGITDLHPDVVVALGKLKYMASGGQSVLQHSIETSQIAGIMAAELNMNVRLARRAALLHDIGKSIPEEEEGNHAAVGAQFLKKYGEAFEVVEAAAKHHNDYLHGVSAITVIVHAANLLSNFRPGARKEFIEKSISRLQNMEASVLSFPDVEQAYVIKSGREVRALVQPSVFDDEAIHILAKSVAKKLRDDLNHSNAGPFPGPIKVILVREQRATHLAK